MTKTIALLLVIYAALFLIFSPVIGFLAYWVFHLSKLGWMFGDLLKKFYFG
jgi:hypothetical protein